MGLVTASLAPRGNASIPCPESAQPATQEVASPTPKTKPVLDTRRTRRGDEGPAGTQRQSTALHESSSTLTALTRRRLRSSNHRHENCYTASNHDDLPNFAPSRRRSRAGQCYLVLVLRKYSGLAFAPGHTLRTKRSAIRFARLPVCAGPNYGGGGAFLGPTSGFRRRPLARGETMANGPGVGPLVRFSDRFGALAADERVV
jgi:hypothetical protein